MDYPKAQMKWRTMDGQILTPSEMATSHLFNSVKMIYNHLAEEFDRPTIWFTKKHVQYQAAAQLNPRALAETLRNLIIELERRNDLPPKYHGPYTVIKNELRGPLAQLPEPKPYSKEARDFLNH